MTQRLLHLYALLTLLLLTLFTPPTRAQGLSFGGGGLSTARPPANSPFTARAAPAASPLIPGKESTIIVEVTIDRRYHIQSAYQPAGSFNIPTTLKPKPLPGITFGTVKFPNSKNVPTPGGLPTDPPIPVYEGTIYLLLPITAQPGAPADQTLELTLNAQACDDSSCLPPKDLSLKVPLKVGSPDATPTPPDPALTAAAEKQPYATPPAPPTTTTSTAPSTTQAAPSTTSATPSPTPTSPGHTIPLLSTEEQLALIKSRPYKPHNTEENNYSLGIIALLALLGGIILNIMPCVLPVIPLKVLSLVQQAHGDRRLAVQHALAFTAGVITLFVALAIILKTFGLFYGQQFQSPAFLITMAMLVVALALSMLGVWTINPPQALYDVDAKLAAVASGTPTAELNYASPQTPNAAKSAYLGAFSNGLMATLLATPCSAPYLGPVFAWAFTQPAWLTAAALALVGLGMSLPYLFLAAFPALLNRLPKAGRWSELLKQGLGIIMLGVVIYLVTLVPNATYWPWILLGTVIVALVCWAWGQIPTGTMSSQRIWTIRGIAIIMGLILGGAVYKIASATESAAGSMEVRAGETAFLPDKSNGQWLPFNLALLDEALKNNRPVVIDWTASWCPNCHALEALVLSREAVQKQFADSNALLLRADLSTDNPPPQALNEKLGGEAIPVLAIFAPSRPYGPVVLRDKYTQTRVIDEVLKAR